MGVDKDVGAGGAPETRHSGHSVPWAPNSTVAVSVCNKILMVPTLAQTISIERGCTTGDATATPSASTNHAKTHTRRLNRVLDIFIAVILDAFNMNHIDKDHLALLG